MGWLLLLWALSGPILLARFILRRYRFYRVAYSACLFCRTCGARISLVGLWECGICHYTYAGHLLRECPVCRSLPKMARCFSCRSTEKLPEL